MNKISAIEKENIIEKWSGVYKRIVGELFTLEELKQEAWLALLEAEEHNTHSKDGEASEETYLTACVKHRLSKFIISEIKHQHCIPINEEEHAVDLMCGTPEELALAQCLLDSLKDKVDISKAFNFRKNTIQKRSAKSIIDLLLSDKSHQEITNTLHRNGIEIGTKNVYAVIKKLRKELAKILKNG